MRGVVIARGGQRVNNLNRPTGHRLLSFFRSVFVANVPTRLIDRQVTESYRESVPLGAVFFPLVRFRSLEALGSGSAVCPRKVREVRVQDATSLFDRHFAVITRDLGDRLNLSVLVDCKVLDVTTEVDRQLSTGFVILHEDV